MEGKFILSKPQVNYNDGHTCLSEDGVTRSDYSVTISDMKGNGSCVTGTEQVHLPSLDPDTSLLFTYVVVGSQVMFSICSFRINRL